MSDPRRTVPGMVPPHTSSCEDADSAWAFAISLQDAGPDRVTAVTMVLVSLWNGDAARLAVAAEVARARQHDPGGDVGWQETADLLDGALALVRTAGANTSDEARERFTTDLRAELFPEPQPFQWPTRRSRHPSWWVRRLWYHLRLRLEREPPWMPGAHQLLRIYIGRLQIGKLDLQVCDQCRRGFVRKFDVDATYRGFGIGERAIAAEHRRYPGYDWSTSVQHPTAGTFWTKVAARTGSSFRESPGGICRHMSHRSRAADAG